MPTTHDERPGPSRAYHHGNLRAALVDAGYALITECGIKGFSLIDCCRRAGVSKAAPYRHFANKEALLVDIAIAGFDRFRALVAEAVGDAGPEEALRRIARRYVRFAQEHPAYVMAMFASELDRTQHPALEQAARGMFREVGATIVRCQRTGLLPDDDAIYRSLTLWLPVHGLAMVLISGTENAEPWVQRTDRLVDDLVTILVHGSAHTGRVGPAAPAPG